MSVGPKIPYSAYDSMLNMVLYFLLALLFFLTLLFLYRKLSRKNKTALSGEEEPDEGYESLENN
ncbi:MAG: hypothetical protein PHV51_09895 [Methanosarcinaceae archaeon]|nr:hypothetical protein [Methanosarcinaceae archaeon]MDD4498442.1 hypothetical protein [Methanosarcinaceae archaeon]